MQVETIGIARSLGWRCHMRCALGHGEGTQALSELNDRERRIFETRRLAEDPITLAELAEEFGVSGECVRQIDVSSFEKVQKAVKNRVAAMESAGPLPVH
jgi:RNA polymerase sigma-32 factor